MPRNETKFNKKWLLQTDTNGLEIHKWCKNDPASSSKAFCFVCSKSFSVSNSGIKQVLTHANGQKHKELIKVKYATDQSHFSFKASSSQNSSSQNKETDSNVVDREPQAVKLNPCLKESAVKSELLWAMKIADSNISYSSCDGTPELFCRMFPDSTIAGNFSMSRTKVSYLISDGLGPYFKKKLCEEVSASPAFVLQYDETGNSQVRKQCDLLLRYWSDSKKQVVVHFLKALMFGHAPGVEIANGILNTLKEQGFQLPLPKLLNLGSDGPNVNKTVWNKVNEEVKYLGYPGLMQFIPCNLHVIHNSFREGLKVYGETAEEFALDLFYFFKSSPCKREDFRNVQEDLGFDEESFVRHIQCRWLTLLPALQRIARNWSAIEDYFLKKLPKQSVENKTQKLLEKNARYLRICRCLKSQETLVQINFLISLQALYDRFLLMFQREDPLVHILYSEMSDMIKSFMLRFIKSDVIGESEGMKLLGIDVDKEDNLLKDNHIEVGESTRLLLRKHPDQCKLYVAKMRKFFQAVTKYLQKRLPLNNELLKALGCLHPFKQKSESGTINIRKIALKMPQVVNDHEIAQITDEWKIYQLETIPRCWIEDDNGKDHRIDDYWAKVLDLKMDNGSFKFKTLSILVKSCLCIAHGNAEVERSLSENKRMLSKERTLLSDCSVNGLRIVKDAVKNKGDVVKVPFTKSLVDAGTHAHKLYIQRLEKEREQAEAEKRKKGQIEKEKADAEEAHKQFEDKKRKLVDREKTLAEDDRRMADDMRLAEKLFEEANSRLKKALKDKNLDEAGIAQGLLDVAKNKMNATRQQMEKNRKERTELGMKRSRMLEDISHCLQKKQKK